MLNAELKSFNSILTCFFKKVIFSHFSHLAKLAIFKVLSIDYTNLLIYITYNLYILISI